MPKFQGSGFEIDVPESCMDASAYAFVLPGDDEYTPFVNIRFELLPENQGLLKYMKTSREALSNELEDFEVLNEGSGKRGEWDVSLVEYAWGPEPVRIYQKQICFLVPGKIAKVYSLTATDLVSRKNQSKPIFDQLFKSFSPNNVQVWEQA